MVNETMNMFEMSPREVKAWLDEGGLFVLPFSQSEYRARKLEDGAYICYHLLYSTFGQLVQRAAAFGPTWTSGEHGTVGETLYDMSYKAQQEALDAGEIFSAPLSNNEAFTMRRLPDGAYVIYSVQRDTFESLQRDMASKGHAELWMPKTRLEVDGHG